MSGLYGLVIKRVSRIETPTSRPLTFRASDEPLMIEPYTENAIDVVSYRARVHASFQIPYYDCTITSATDEKTITGTDAQHTSSVDLIEDPYYRTASQIPFAYSPILRPREEDLHPRSRVCVELKAVDGVVVSVGRAAGL